VSIGLGSRLVVDIVIVSLWTLAIRISCGRTGPRLG